MQPRATFSTTDMPVSWKFGSDVDHLFRAPPAKSKENLELLFTGLTSSTADDKFLEHGAHEVVNRLHHCTSASNISDPGAQAYVKICVEAGIVKAMLYLTTLDHRGSTHRATAGYYALESLLQLLFATPVPERRALRDHMIENDIVNVCLKKIHHDLSIHRSLTYSFFRLLAGECFLTERLTSAQIADIMTEACKFILTGREVYVQEMLSPTTAWQSRIIMKSADVPYSRASKYASRYFAMAQEDAIWTVHGLLCTSPAQNRKFCFEITKKRPEILDLLFDCATTERMPWYPETQVDSIACEILALLFHCPLQMVPGLPAVADNWSKTDEWKYLSQAITKLTSREEWDAKIIDVWSKIEQEDTQEVAQMISRVGTDYFAQHPPDYDQAFPRIFECRGGSRISMLRMIATITHAAESAGVSNVALLSFLRICYTASHKVPIQSPDFTPEEKHNYIERTYELYRSPRHTNPAEIVPEVGEQIAGECIIGPIALVRLLTVLAQRNALDGLPALRKSPPGLSPTTTLHDIQQITHPDTIRRLLQLSLRRVTARREEGRTRLARQKDLGYACMAYTTSAELALALFTFDEATRGKYTPEIRGARKEFVLCIGNASEMTLRMRHWDRALKFGLGACDVAREIPTEEGLDTSTLAKNMRRVELARAGLARA